MTAPQNLNFARASTTNFFAKDLYIQRERESERERERYIYIYI